MASASMAEEGGECQDEEEGEEGEEGDQGEEGEEEAGEPARAAAAGCFAPARPLAAGDVVLCATMHPLR